MGIGDLMNAAKALSLTEEQKAAVKKIVKGAAGNKTVIAAELKKHNIPVSADQIDMVIKMVEKL